MRKSDISRVRCLLSTCLVFFYKDLKGYYLPQIATVNRIRAVIISNLRKVRGDATYLLFFLFGIPPILVSFFGRVLKGRVVKLTSVCLTATAMGNNNALSLILLLTFGVGVRSDDSRMNRVTQSICGEDALLHCLAKSKPGVQYKSVIWYKVSDAPSRLLTGLVLKKLSHHNDTVHRYKGVQQDVMLLADSHSLVLPNVTLQDSGRYLCLLSAPVGHQHQEGEIDLMVYDGYNNDIGTSNYQDTFYEILAITLLIVALLMLYVSYKTLKNTLLKHKSKFSKETSKKIHQMKHSIIKMESKGIVCSILPQQYV